MHVHTFSMYEYESEATPDPILPKKNVEDYLEECMCMYVTNSGIRVSFPTPDLPLTFSTVYSNIYNRITYAYTST